MVSTGGSGRRKEGRGEEGLRELAWGKMKGEVVALVPLLVLNVLSRVGEIIATNNETD